MQSIDQLRWKVKKSTPYLQLKDPFNGKLSLFKNLSSNSLKECISQIYAKVYDGAEFPFPSQPEEKPPIIIS